MLDDIVIDTNVFVYSNNRKSNEFKNSVKFLRKFRKSSTKLCIDKGFHENESKNRSQIVYEYRKKIGVGSYGYNVLVHQFQNRRIIELSKNAPNKTKAAKFIQQKIKNKFDRVFAGVSYNSSEKYLVSYDFTDFPVWLRKDIRKKGIGIKIILPSTANSNL